MITLGIDPGLSGALALYDSDRDTLVVYDVPTFDLKRNGKNKREVDLQALANIARQISAAKPVAYVEQVGAMPGQGVSSVFAFGKVYGALLMAVAASQIPMERVTPQVWKKALQVPAAKDGARARASELLPAHADLWKRVKDDGRAEASLIALYGARRPA